jgi:hypothetical protein
LLSDFLYPDGFEEGLRFLQFHRHDVFCLQIQDDNDRRCMWKGDIDLECVETSKRKRVTISPRETQLYEKAVADWNESLRRFSVRAGIGLAYTTTDPPFELVLQDILRRGGLVA